MFRVMRSIFIAGAASVFALNLSGCEAGDAAYFNVAAQCYSSYPNDSWAQQQCIDRGNSAVQYYQAERACDYDVEDLHRNDDRYWDMIEEMDRLLMFTQDQVERFRENFRECIAQYTYDQCEAANNRPILANIAYSDSYLNELENYEGSMVRHYNEVVSRCSYYYSFADMQRLPRQYYSGNRSVFNEWREHINSSSNQLRRAYRK